MACKDGKCKSVLVQIGGQVVFLKSIEDTDTVVCEYCGQQAKISSSTTKLHCNYCGGQLPFNNKRKIYNILQSLTADRPNIVKKWRVAKLDKGYAGSADETLYASRNQLIPNENGEYVTFNPEFMAFVYNACEGNMQLILDITESMGNPIDSTGRTLKSCFSAYLDISLDEMFKLDPSGKFIYDNMSRFKNIPLSSVLRFYGVYKNRPHDAIEKLLSLGLDYQSDESEFDNLIHETRTIDKELAKKIESLRNTRNILFGTQRKRCVNCFSILSKSSNLCPACEQSADIQNL